MKLTRDYFDHEEVALIGLSHDEKSYSQMVLKALLEKEIRTYPVNNRTDVEFKEHVFGTVNDLPDTTTTAIILLNPEMGQGVAKDLIDKGIKKIVIRSEHHLSADDHFLCKNNDVTITIGCPLMALGSGLHRFHGFLAGVK